MEKSIYLLAAFFLLFFPHIGKSHQELEKSFEVKKFEIIKSNDKSVVRFKIQSNIEADYMFYIQIPKNMSIYDIPLYDSSFNSKKNDVIDKEWSFKMPPDGHYFLQVSIKVKPKQFKPGFDYYSNKVIYFEVKNNNIESYQYDIDTNYYRRPSETKGKKKPQK